MSQSGLSATTKRKTSPARLQRETRSRKSGHTCTICGAVFGLGACLAEHREVHLNSRKSNHDKMIKIYQNNLTNSQKNPRQLPKGNKRLSQPAEYSKLDGLSLSTTRTTMSNIEKTSSVSQSLSKESDECCSGGDKPFVELRLSHEKSYSHSLLDGHIGSLNSDVQLSGKSTECEVRNIFHSQLLEAGTDSANVQNNEKLQIKPKHRFTKSKLLNNATLVRKKDFGYREMSACNTVTAIQNEKVGKTLQKNMYSPLDISEHSAVENDIHSRGSVTSEMVHDVEKLSELSGTTGTMTDRLSFIIPVAKMSSWQNFECLKGANLSAPIKENDIAGTASFLVSTDDLLDVKEEIVCTDSGLERDFYNSLMQQGNTTFVSSRNTLSQSDNKLPGRLHTNVIQRVNNVNRGRPPIRMVSLLKQKQRNEKSLILSADEITYLQDRRQPTVKNCGSVSVSVVSLLAQQNLRNPEVEQSFDFGDNLSVSPKVVLVKKSCSVDEQSPIKQKTILLSRSQGAGNMMENRSIKEHNCQRIVAYKSVVISNTVEKLDNESNSNIIENESSNSSHAVESYISQENDPASVGAMKSLSLSSMYEKTASVDAQKVHVTDTLKLQAEKAINIQTKTKDIVPGIQENLGAKLQPTANGLNTTEFEPKEDNLNKVSELDQLTEKPAKNITQKMTKSLVSCPLCIEKFPSLDALDLHFKAQHACSLCDHQFRQASSLRRHIRIRHSSHRPHKCDTCGKCFPFLSLLKEHLQVHSDGIVEKIHTCEVCGKAFTRASSLRKHSKEEHLSVKPYVCMVCKKGFAYLCSLKGHMRVHSGERPYRCEVCGLSFKQNSNLSKHTRLLHGAKCKHCPGKCFCGQLAKTTESSCSRSTICEVCGKVCEGQKQLVIHMRMHTGEKPEVCDVCGKAYQHKSNLLKHQRQHSGIKAFVCQFCSRAFYANHSLQSHMRLHTGESPFQCDMCLKHFCTRNGLQVHMLLHGNIRPFFCDICGKTFTQLGNLNKHIALHTGERPFVCIYCNKGFVDSSSLKRHIAKHTGERSFPCSFCSKWFRHFSELRSHELAHVGKQAQLQRWVCDICDKSFRTQSNHVQHLKRSHNLSSIKADDISLNPGEYVVYLTE